MLLVPTHVMLACTQGQTLESPVPGSEAKDGNCSHSVLTKRFSLCFGARTSGSDYSHSRSLHGGWRTHCQIVELSCSAMLCYALLLCTCCYRKKRMKASASRADSSSSCATTPNMQCPGPALFCRAFRGEDGKGTLGTGGAVMVGGCGGRSSASWSKKHICCEESGQECRPRGQGSGYKSSLLDAP